jgi:NAD(P)-dependent dehydrogenase (short-subunit alcohol dehydrogenase family)
MFRRQENVSFDPMSKLALVTGASSGVGAQAAAELTRRGCYVILVARDVQRLAKVAASIGSSADFRSCDASSGPAVVALAEDVRNSFGIPDIIVNSRD